MRTPFHDPLIIPLEKGYLGLSTDLQVAGVQARTSDDLITWSEPFPLLKETPPSVWRHVHTDHFWAPELIRRGEKWRLYCCASRFGKTHSIIGLAEAACPTGPYEYLGDVVVTNHADTVTQPNAIDPCVIADREGKDWLIYGSFFGGIRILPLGEDGFPSDFHEGACIAGGNHQAIEGAFAIYDDQADRFILFTSWGDLKHDYHVRIGYSKEVTGPYLDSNGIPLTDIDPINTPGDKLSGGYNFDLPDLPGVMATGHNSVMRNSEGLFMVNHARPEGDVKHPFLQVRRLLFHEDGRISAWPLTYDGHPLTHADTLPEHWQMVHLSRTNHGVVYGRPVTLALAQAQVDGDSIRMTLFCKEWSGYIYRQGNKVACSLLSPDGESLWGVAQGLCP